MRGKHQPSVKRRGASSASAEQSASVPTTTPGGGGGWARRCAAPHDAAASAGCLTRNCTRVVCLKLAQVPCKTRTKTGTQKTKKKSELQENRLPPVLSQHWGAPLRRQARDQRDAALRPSSRPLNPLKARDPNHSSRCETAYAPARAEKKKDESPAQRRRTQAPRSTAARRRTNRRFSNYGTGKRRVVLLISKRRGARADCQLCL
jgi:hypothetical protein